MCMRVCVHTLPFIDPHQPIDRQDLLLSILRQADEAKASEAGGVEIIDKPTVAVDIEWCVNCVSTCVCVCLCLC